MSSHSYGIYMKPITKAAIVEAAVNMWDCDEARAERDLIACDWFIDPRLRGWLLNHGFAV